jgi:hypothetical protein
VQAHSQILRRVVTVSCFFRALVFAFSLGKNHFFSDDPALLAVAPNRFSIASFLLLLRLAVFLLCSGVGEEEEEEEKEGGG